VPALYAVNSYTIQSQVQNSQKCYMRAAQKERNQNAVQVTRDSQWMNRDFGLLVYGTLEVYRARYSKTLASAKKLRGLASQNFRICLSTTTPMCQLQPLLYHPPYTNFICKLHALFVRPFLCVFFQFSFHLLFFFSIQVTSGLTNSLLPPPPRPQKKKIPVS